MKSKIMRIGALLLVLIFSLTLLQGCGTPKETEKQSATTQTGSNTPAEQTKEEKTTLVSKELITLTLTTPEEGWVQKNTLPFFQELLKKTNVLLDLKTVPAPYDDKYKAMFAAGDLSDITNGYFTTKEYANAGIFVNLKDYEADMPNFLSFKSKFPDMIDRIVVDDKGSYYKFPQIYDWKEGYIDEGILYRADVFEKNNISIPKTWDEFYEMLKKLKQLYPKSNPLIGLWGSWYPMLRFSQAWDTGYGEYYNVDTKQWQYGPIEENFKALLTYMNKLYKEGLLDPEWATGSQDWDALMDNDKAFVSWMYIDYIKRAMSQGTQINPDFKLLAMATPQLKPGVKPKLSTLDSILPPQGLAISAKSKHIKEAVKLIDFLYSPEGIELTNWGIEGLTFTRDSSGKRSFTDAVATGGHPTVGKPKTEFGMYNINAVFEEEGYSAYEFTPLTMQAFEQVVPNVTPVGQIQIPVQKFTDAEIEEDTDISKAADTYKEEMCLKFISGKEPLSKWDEYVQHMKGLKVEKLIENYNNAVKRAQK